MCDPFFDSRQGALEARVVERFQQIVEGAGFEGTQRIAVVSGDENDRGRSVAAQQLQDIKAIAFWHLHVEKYHIRVRGAERRDCLSTGRTFGNLGNVGITLQKERQIASGQWLIVDD
jgi:chloramphenicol 3-O-phosphotransferase